MQIRKFKYINNSMDIFFGLLFIGFVVLLINAWGVPSFSSMGIHLVMAIFYSAFLLLLLWACYYYFKTYFKLRGKDRFIIIDEKAIVFPEFGDSLNIIKIYFSDINDVYFAEGRHGIPDNLIIKYGSDGHAYIYKEGLLKNDFDEICNLFMQHLRLSEIEVRSA